MDDPRFAHITTDPRFKRVSKRHHKVTIDNRFRSMFTDKKFKLKYCVDKRGKKVSESSKENLRQYYSLQEEEEGEDGESDKEEEICANTVSGEEDKISEGNAGDSEDEREGDNCESSDSSSTDLDYNALEHHDEVSYDWGNLATDITRSHDTSHRLAVCNMNWDRITAQDLFVLFNSFKPENGVIHSVKIYVSDFGKERLAKEEIEGPAELVEKSYGEEEEDNPDKIEGEDFAREKLRQYQLNRLKYYYAIVECSDRVTAEHLYDECDGLEYENSASNIDLRFVPSDMEFEDEPCTIATENNLTTDFEPSIFFTSALQQTSVNLTWDETDPIRLKKTMRKFNKDELENVDFGAYLASSSDEESLLPAKHSSKAYRSLLGIKDQEEQESSEGGKQQQRQEEEEEEELEITWNIGLNEKEKEKVKKGENDKQKKIKEEEDNEADLGFDDPFFTQELLAKPTGRKKHKKGKLSQEDLQEHERQKSELELLMMSDDEDTTGKRHFSLKDIKTGDQKEKGRKKRKKRKLKEEQTSVTMDGFSVDTSDPRFSALYESHVYAIDPTHPQYKQTKGMEEILTEKQQRSRNKKFKRLEEPSSAIDHGLGVLVKSVRAKASTYMEKRRKKKHPLI